MDRAKKVVNEKNERILLEMTKQPGNDTCADCGAKGPRWASHNLGVFLCIRCGGLHRKMGTHISKVKSISLDSWTPEQIENMRQWGNLKANAKWNPHSELHPVPVNASDSEMERYIRNKYERQIYRDHPDKPKQSTFSSSVPPPTPPRRAANDSIIKYNNNERGNHDSALRQLKDMGFNDHARNREVLNTTNGDLSAAIEILCRLPSGSAPSASSSLVSNISSDDKLTQLWNMGFQDEAKNRDALRRTGGNVEVAAALLLEARNAESLNNNSASSPKPNPSVNPQTEQQRMQIKLPISQSSGQSLINSSSSQQISFQKTTQNSSQTILDAFGSLSSETEIQQPLTQQQQNKFDKNAILSLFSAPQQSLISHNPNSFNSINNGIPLRSSSSAEQQNQFSQTQQNLVSRGVGFNSNQSILSNSTFENARTSTPSGTDLFGLNFGPSSSTMSSNEFNGLNSGFSGRMNSYEARAYDGSIISNTSNIPFRTNNALSIDNNLFGASMRQNSIVSPEMMVNRQNSLPNVTSISSFPLIENTNISYTSMNTTSGQLQQIAPSGFGAQQISPFSNGQPNQSNELLSQQKSLISITNQNQNQSQSNNNNHLFSAVNGNGFMSSTTSTNFGWPNMNH